MKRGKERTSVVWVLLAVCFLSWTIWASFLSSPRSSVRAFAEGYDLSYGFTVTKYSVEMDVHSDRTIDVTEIISVDFLGWHSHGIIRDFPLGGGVRYRNIVAVCNSKDFSPYFEEEDEFLCYYLRGEKTVTGESRTYGLSYTMSVPKLEDEGSMPLNIIGYGWQSYQGISSFSAEIRLPVAAKNVGVYSGQYGTTENEYVQMEQEGNTIYLKADSLPTADIDGYGNATAAGVTLDLSFDPSDLTVAPDWALIMVILLSVIAIGGMGLFVFLRKKTPVIPVVNLTVPDEMDPLRMGKIIDNHVDTEDIGAMVFWFADQGYLDIDFSVDENDPFLRRTDKPAPEEGYQRCMWQGLFEHGSEVRVSSLENSFYKTADVLKLAVPSVSSGMFRLSSLFKAAGGCFACFVLLHLLFIKIRLQTQLTMILDDKFMLFGTFIVSLICFLVTAFASLFSVERKYRWAPWKQWLLRLSALAACFAVGAVFCTETTISFSGWVAPIVVWASSILGFLLPFGFDYTKEYAEKLGQIVGFRNFILYTEKDRIRFMLQENPELYYHILPYAQVLGVTKEWTDKFKGLSMTPPVYADFGRRDMLFDCMIWNATFRSLGANLSMKMTSRPSPQGNGSSFGGFGGGHGGSGHGGGFGGGGFGGGVGRGC